MTSKGHPGDRPLYDDVKAFSWRRRPEPKSLADLKQVWANSSGAATQRNENGPVTRGYAGNAPSAAVDLQIGRLATIGELNTDPEYFPRYFLGRTLGKYRRFLRFRAVEPLFGRRSDAPTRGGQVENTSIAESVDLVQNNNRAFRTNERLPNGKDTGDHVGRWLVPRWSGCAIVLRIATRRLT